MGLPQFKRLEALEGEYILLKGDSFHRTYLSTTVLHTGASQIIDPLQASATMHDTALHSVLSTFHTPCIVDSLPSYTPGMTVVSTLHVVKNEAQKH